MVLAIREFSVLNLFSNHKRIYWYGTDIWFGLKKEMRNHW